MKKNKMELINNSSTGKLSLAHCKKILNADSVLYTDDEIIELRDWLHHMAEIVFDTMDREEERKHSRVNKGETKKD
jgi:hypothetical protein